MFTEELVFEQPVGERIPFLVALCRTPTQNFDSIWQKVGDACIEYVLDLPPHQQLPFLEHCAKEHFASVLLTYEEALFHLAADEPVSARESFLKAHCGNRLDMLERLRKMLSVENQIPENPIFGDPLIGALVGHHYLIKEKIGYGGFSTVYRAVAHNNEEINYAIKFLNRNVDATREIRHMVTCNHPNIVRIYAHGTHRHGLIGPNDYPDEQEYIVMSYLPGPASAGSDEEPIFTRYARGLNTTAEKIQLCLQVCRAVQAAHGLGIIHCDIKPGNILLDNTNQARLADLGAAFSGNKGEKYDLKFYTPRYAAPEQLPTVSPKQGRSPVEPEKHWDIYALGVVLYEVLTDGRWPHGSYDDLKERYQDQDSALLAALIEAKSRTFVPLKLSRDDEDLAWIIEKSLQPAPNRYQSVEELIGDLKRWQQKQPISLRQKDRVYRVQKFFRRDPIKAWSLSLLTLCACLFPAILTHIYLEQHFTREFQKDDELVRLDLAYRTRGMQIEPFERALEKRAQYLEKKAKDPFPWGQWQANFMLGRIYLQLNRVDEALHTLEQASQHHQDSELALTYALALIEQHQFEVDKLRLRGVIPQDQLNTLAQTYLLPARECLGFVSENQVPGESDKTRLFLARSLKANLEGHHYEALSELKSIGHEDKLDYQNMVLAGDILREQGYQTRVTDSQKATLLYREAMASYQQALDYAPSDPAVILRYLSICQLLAARDRDNAREVISLGLAKSDELEHISPNLAGNFLYRSYLHYHLSRLAGDLERESEHREAALDAAHRSLSLVESRDPWRPRILANLGAILRDKGSATQDANTLRNAIDITEQALLLEPNTHIHVELAHSWLELATMEEDLEAIEQGKLALEKANSQSMTAAQIHAALLKLQARLDTENSELLLYTAADKLERALDSREELDLKACYFLGNIYVALTRHLGNQDALRTVSIRAQELFEVIKLHTPDNWKVLASMGQLHENLWRFPLHENDREAHYILACWYYQASLDLQCSTWTLERLASLEHQP